MEETKRAPEALREAKDHMLKTMDYITEILIEINAAEEENGVDEALHARKAALVEVLAKLMEWPDAKKYGYDWKAEEEFPI